LSEHCLGRDARYPVSQKSALLAGNLQAKNKRTASSTSWLEEEMVLCSQPAAFSSYGCFSFLKDHLCPDKNSLLVNPGRFLALASLSLLASSVSLRPSEPGVLFHRFVPSFFETCYQSGLKSYLDGEKVLACDDTFPSRGRCERGKSSEANAIHGSAKKGKKGERKGRALLSRSFL